MSCRKTCECVLPGSCSRGFQRCGCTTPCTYCWMYLNNSVTDVLRECIPGSSQRRMAETLLQQPDWRHGNRSQKTNNTQYRRALAVHARVDAAEDDRGAGAAGAAHIWIKRLVAPTEKCGFNDRCPLTVQGRCSGGRQRRWCSRRWTRPPAPARASACTSAPRPGRA